MHRHDGLSVAKHGGFSSGAMNNSYLTLKSPETLLGAGQWCREDGMRSAYFHERFCMEIPESLLQRVYAGLLRVLDGAAAEVGNF